MIKGIFNGVEMEFDETKMETVFAAKAENDKILAENEALKKDIEKVKGENEAITADRDKIKTAYEKAFTGEPPKGDEENPVDELKKIISEAFK